MAPVTNPPPPGNWGPPQPPYGQGQPPYASGPWPPQQGWGPPPQPPKNSSLKWLLIGVAVLLVIAISVGATLLFTRDGGDGTTQTANGNPPAAGEIASANDTGPVSIITEDPTCAAWRPINDTLAEQQAQGWSDRDYSQPASEWTAEQRTLHENIAQAMRSAADQTVSLAEKTPNRPMRELYEQAIAYWRAYADSVPNYEAQDNDLAGVAANASGAVVMICAAIDYRSAEARSPLITVRASPPSNLAVSSNLPTPQRFITRASDAGCDDWKALVDKFDADAGPWRGIDPNIPASEWNADQKSSMSSMQPVFTKLADDIESLANRTDNPTFEDFATLSSLYWRAFAAGVPSYTSADSYLSGAASYINFLIFDACNYSGG